MNLKLLIIFLVLGLSQTIHAFESKIYISGHKEPYQVNEMQQVFEAIEMDKTTKNIVFYVHGRGKHPEKGIAYLPDLEKRYNIRVIMFSWKSWINFVTRPVASAVTAAKDLDVAFRSIKQFKKKRPSFFKNRNFSFLAHSMGTIVLKSYMNSLYRKKSYNSQFFDTLTLNAADLALFGHKGWLSKIDFSKNIYSTYNKGDAVLLGSKIIDYTRFSFFSGPRLGKSLKYGFIKAKLASNTLYLNFSKLTKSGHSHHRNEEKNKTQLNQIFNYILNGAKLPLIKSLGVSSVRDRVVYFYKK